MTAMDESASSSPQLPNTTTTLEPDFSNLSSWQHASNVSMVVHNDSASPSGVTRNIMGWLYLVLIPTIIVVGLCGNALSFGVFVLTPLRNLSSSVYLAALAVADTGFLLTLTLTWMDIVKWRLFHTQGICQLAVYLNYVFSFLSVWYVVSFTVERFLAVGYPLQKHKLCTPRRAKLVVTALAMVAAVAYSFALWTSEVVRAQDGRKVCVPARRYYSVVEMAGNVDTVITFIVPFVSIVILNIRIVYVMFHDKAPRERCSVRSLAEESPASGLVSPSTGKSRRVQARQTQTYITRMLVVVSTVFLLLNLPSHAMRVYIFVLSALHQESQFTSSHALLQQIFQYLYYTNFSVNFFLYNLCGRNFRRSLGRLLQACTRCKGEPLRTRRTVSFRWTRNPSPSRCSEVSMKTLTVQLSNNVSANSETASV